MSYFNVAAMKNELANGVSMDELAKAMTDALNEAQKQYEAEEAKRKEAEAQKEKETAITKARADVYLAYRKYLELTMPALSEICDEDDWADLEKTMSGILNEMEDAFKMLVPMMSLAKKTEKNVCYTHTQAPDKNDVLADFLRSNGLL
jgi:regulator of protease activity HflC (stomatin/prohibitin superfamily)